jgi:hypothetical protein
MSEAPPPGIPVLKRTLDAIVRVWFRHAGPSAFAPYESMDVHLRGAGEGDQDYLERQLRELLPPGARLVRYELIG